MPQRAQGKVQLLSQLQSAATEVSGEETHLGTCWGVVTDLQSSSLMASTGLNTVSAWAGCRRPEWLVDMVGG